MPPATPRREQIAMELRGHISERLAAGQPLEEVLDQLGDPVALAESYLSAVPLVAGDFWSRATARLIDFGLPVVLLSPVSALIWFATPPEYVPALLFVYLFVGGAAIAIYPMVAEAKYGKTVGKHLRGLRVVTRVWRARSAPARPSCATCPGCWSSSGSTRCLRCSRTSASAPSSCCRRRASCGRPAIRAERQATTSAPDRLERLDRQARRGRAG